MFSLCGRAAGECSYKETPPLLLQLLPGGDCECVCLVFVSFARCDSVNKSLKRGFRASEVTFVYHPDIMAALW